MRTVSLYGLVIFEDKGHIFNGITAIFISTNPCLIRGICSYAPASTMVRLRLQRAATESSGPTGVKPRINLGHQRIPGTARERAGIDRDRAGIAKDRAGTARDRVGLARDRAVIARDRAGIARERLEISRDRAGIARDIAGIVKENGIIGEIPKPRQTFY